MTRPTIRQISFFFILAACHRPAPQGAMPPASRDARLEAVLARVSGTIGPSYFLLPASTDFERIPQDPKNPLTPEKVELGRLLFHETALGTDPKLPLGMGTYSCASCHHAQAGFQAGLIQGIAEGGRGFGHNGEARSVDPEYPTDSIDVQPIRTPSALNIAYQTNVLWSGALGATGINRNTKYAWAPNKPPAFNRLGLEGTETQAMVALDVHRMSVPGLLSAYPEYKAMFDRTFPDVSENRRYTRRNGALAIAAFERTLLANEAPFQHWLRGDSSAMSATEKEGAILFFGKAGCVRCHSGPALNSMRFAALGMKDLFQDSAALNAAIDSLPNLGRASFTRNGDDLFMFKVPQLYNLSDAPFYGHGGSFTRIRDVVSYINRAVPENSIVRKRFLAPEFQPLGLTEAEIDVITAFLSGALRDGNLERYLPPQVPSGNCFPNNDPRSRTDIACN